jgi:hypothetical protein
MYNTLHTKDNMDKSAHVTFELKIDSGNAAMQSPEDVAAALKHVAKKLPKRFRRAGGSEYTRAIIDENGNTIGSWTLTITEE